MKDVIESCDYVVRNSKYVKINEKEAGNICGDIRRADLIHWSRKIPFPLPQLKFQEKLNFFVLFNSLSFSYWGEPKWTVRHRNRNFDGSWGLVASVFKSVENNIPILDAKIWDNFSEDEFTVFLTGNTQIPLFAERLEIINEVGSILNAKYKGDFLNVVEDANYDAEKLVDEIVKNFPNFMDTNKYKGEDIFFYKRAQLLAADVSILLDLEKKKGLTFFNNLTVCADYKLPQILRHLGILEYDEKLAGRIETDTPLLPGSQEEIEIRASTVIASEIIKDSMNNSKGKNRMSSMELNNWLWLYTQDEAKKLNFKPYHRTRTIAY